MAAETSCTPMQEAFKVASGRFPRMKEAPVRLMATQSGQSLIEACLAMGILCLVFFGLFQLSQLAAAREVLNHAAARGARAKTVGFNHFMVSKAVRVAAIPNAGHMLVPGFLSQNDVLLGLVENLSPGDLWDTILGGGTPIPTAQQDLESARIPEYMGSHNWAQANFILDYEDWGSINPSFPFIVSDGAIMDVNVSQNYPLRVPLHRTFYAPEPNADGIDTVLLHGHSSIEGHYPLYLDDVGW